MKRRVWGPYQNIVKDDLNDIGTFAQEAVEMALAAITPPARLSGLQASAISSNTVKVTAGWMVVSDSTVGRPRLGVLAGDTNLTVSGPAGTYLVVAIVSEQDLETRTIAPPPQTLPNGQPNPFYDPTLNPYNQVTLKGWQVSLSLRPGSYTPANREAVVAQVTWDGSAITGVTQVLGWPKLNIADRSIPAIKIADDLAGNGTSRNASGGIQVNVDNSTVEISSNTLRVKDGGITDAKLGNRTISDGTSPSSDTGTLTSLLSGLANRIKAITGGTTWRDAPATTISELNANVARKGNNETITGAWTFALDGSGTLRLAKANGDLLYLHATAGGAGNTGNIVFKGYTEPSGTANPALKLSFIDDGNYSSHLAILTKVPGADGNPLTERLRLTSQGRLGIGTSNPSEALEVNGNVKATSFIGNLATVGNLTVSGNIGVGTTSPSEKLEVSDGSVKAQRFISTASTGTAPLQVSSTTLVGNLNSDLLDGYHASTTPSANTIPVLDSAGALNLPHSDTPVKVNGQPYTHRTFYVDQANGNDANPGTSSSPFRTIAKAIQSVPDGGTGDIYVVGNYDFNEGRVHFGNKRIHLHLLGTLTVGWRTIDGYDWLSGGFHLYGGASLRIRISSADNGKLVINDRVTTNPIAPPGRAFVTSHGYAGVNTIFYDLWVFVDNYNPIYLGKDAYLGTNETWDTINNFTVFRLQGHYEGTNRHVIVKDPSTSVLMHFAWGGSGTYLVNYEGGIKDAYGTSLNPSTLVSGVVKDTNGLPLNVLSNLDITNGKVIEYDSTSNGSYIRFADGTQICWASHDPTSFGIMLIGEDTNYKYKNKTWVFPAAFITTPVVTTSGDVVGARMDATNVYSVTTTQCTLEVGQYNTIAVDVGAFYTLAIGRWK